MSEQSSVSKVPESYPDFLGGLKVCCHQRQNIQILILPSAYWWALSRVLLSQGDTCPEPWQCVIMIKAQLCQLGAFQCPCFELCCSELVPNPLSVPCGQLCRERQSKHWRVEEQAGTRPGRVAACLQHLLICVRRSTFSPRLTADYCLTLVVVSQVQCVPKPSDIQVFASVFFTCGALCFSLTGIDLNFCLLS